jgi:hypothetical protein
MLHAVTSRLPTAASVALLHVATSLSRLAVTNRLLHVAISLLQIAAKNPLHLVVTSRLLRAVKNHTHPVVKNRTAIVATPHAVTNLMPHAAKILSQMRVLSHVRLNHAVTAAPRIVLRTPVSPLAQHATLHHVLQHPVAKPLRHAVMVQRAQVHHAQVLHVPPQARVVVLPLTAVAVNS